MTALGSVLARVTGMIDGPTQPYRRRYAADIVLTGRARRLDALVSRAYFVLDARSWDRLPDIADYLDPLNAGLDQIRAPRRVLDIGTGAGASSRAVADRFPAALVTGVDLSRAMLRRARAHGGPSTLSYRRASLTALPFDAGTFDLVLALNAIVDVGEVRRVLAPDGQVLMVSTSYGLRDAGSDWMRRWSECGFTRAAAGAAARGSWEIFEPSTTGRACWAHR